MAQSGKIGSDRGKKPTSPNRGKLRIVKEPDRMHVLSLRLPRVLFDRLKEVAKNERRSFNNQVAIVVEEWLDRKESKMQRVAEAAASPESAKNNEDGW